MDQMEQKQESTKGKIEKAEYLENRYLAIDPGKSGGVAVLDGDSVVVWNCPPTPAGMADVILDITNASYVDGYTLRCVIELVHAFPGDGRSSVFKFGTNYGTWIGILESRRVKYKFVSPRKWQAAYQPLPKIKKERKNKLKEIAKSFYPKATLITSDAICLALYAQENWNEL